jgi:hypothetical protein
MGFVLLVWGCAYLYQTENILYRYTLPERVEDADVIVIGELIDRKERVHRETYGTLEDRTLVKRYYYYDVAEVRVIEVLKGECEGDVIVFRLPSEDQSQPQCAETESGHFSPHDIWQRGAWLFNYDSDRGPPLRANRGGFVPSERIAEVREVLAEGN